MNRWSLYNDRCIDCGTTEKRHVSLGLCTTCYKRRLRQGTRPNVEARPWSAIAPACVRCGRTNVRHRARGLCRGCYTAAYVQTEAGRTASRVDAKRYVQTERGKAMRRRSYARWLQKPDSPEKVRRASRRTRERKYGLGVELPIGYEALVFEVFGRRCACCGAVDDLVLDHHHPLHEGVGLLHNAVPLCRSCNCRKNRKTPADFYDATRLAEIEHALARLRKAYDHHFDSSLDRMNP